MSEGFGNRAMELAAMRAEQERQVGVSIAIAAMEGEGSDRCVDCGSNISPERRVAMPSAKRCVGCQDIHERGPK